MQNTTLILGLNPTWQRLFITEDLVLGKIHRLPKPVEFASGKGINCGRVLDLLGGKPILLHFLGGANGRFIFDELAAAGLVQIPVWIQANTRISTTLVSETTTELIEPSPEISPEENADFIKTLIENWDGVDRIVISGSFPLSFDTQAFFETNLKDKRIFIDAVTDIEEWLEKGVELLKINSNEYFTLLKQMEIPQVTSSPKFWEISAEGLLSKLPIRYLVVTDEENLVRAFFIEEEKLHFAQLKPPTVSVLNSIGAGDSFLAGWLRGDGLQLSFEEKLCKATAVAAARCEVDRPWNIRLERVLELESKLQTQIEWFNN